MVLLDMAIGFGWSVPLQIPSTPHWQLPLRPTENPTETGWGGTRHGHLSADGGKTQKVEAIFLMDYLRSIEPDMYQTLFKNCINHQINWFSSPDFWTITWMLFFAGDFLRIVMPWDSSPIRKPTIFFVGHFFPRHTTYLGGGFKYFLCSPLFGVRFPIWLIFFTWVETTN